MSDNGLVFGIVAHVDAGKTTLAESMLYLGGQIRRLGRVDHKDTVLDNFALERERGITIFSKQARLKWRDREFTLLDTPGHVDFSAEMERTLQVLDCAVLVVNGADGVQGHTRTLWRLLERYEIPVFLFINKMDQPGTDRDKLMEELKRQLDANCVAFPADSGCAEESRQSAAAGLTDAYAEELAEELVEELATCEEGLMNAYLERGTLTREEIAGAVAQRSVFPCFFGAALHVEGVEALLDGIAAYGLRAVCSEMAYSETANPEEFGARVFKISRDPGGARLTHLRVTGGSLRVKTPILSEKVNQIRLYNGAAFEAVEEVHAGEICAVTGLTRTFAGQGLGAEPESGLPVLEPVLTYRVELPEGEDAVQALIKLRGLEEEEPLLHLVWQEESREIHAQVMGEVQIEVLKKLIAQRFGLEVEFGAGSIVYKESIAERAIGIGHFEPLRHYAEVELLLEPGERGSGLQFASLCSEDMLDRNWQRLVLTHLEEKVHVGVLTGSPITDMRILLVGGRAHLKHTEGGDFRQATYRALRQGLRSSKNVLLEPVFAFVLELPTEYLGRAMSDMQRMHGSFDAPETEGGRSVLTGRAPVAAMRDYQKEVYAYTHGEGHLSCIPDGYEPCHNAEEVISERGYDPEGDLENPTGSVFCAHGAGFVVDWDHVAEYAHVELPEGVWRLVEEDGADCKAEYGGNYGEECGEKYREEYREKNMGRYAQGNAAGAVSSSGGGEAERYITQEEIEAIFRQTYGGREHDRRRRRRYHVTRRDVYANDGKPGGGSGYNGSEGNRTGRNRSGGRGTAEPKEVCLLVDGYNIIFAWEELRSLAQVNIDSARDRLMDIMSNYQGIWGGTLILVFDAYKVKGNPGSVLQYHNIHVVYTKEAETADQYIEKTVHGMTDRFQVTVATSDALEQMIIWGAGALRMSAAGLYAAVEEALGAMREEYTERDSRIAFRPFL